MANTVTNPPPLPPPTTLPGTEIRAVSLPSGGGLAVLGESINSLWWSKQGQHVADCGYVAADGVLGTVEARDRRYTIKTPHYAGHSGPHVKVYLDAVYDSTTWQVKVHIGGTSSAALTIAASGLYNAGVYSIADTTDTTDVRIEYVSSGHAGNYIQGIFVTHYLVQATLDTGAFANGAAGVVASDISQLGDEAPASTFILKQMTDMVQNIYERRTGMCYTSGLEYNLVTSPPTPPPTIPSGGTRSVFALATLFAPHGCAGWTAYIYVSGVSAGTRDLVWVDLDNAETATVTGMAAAAWTTFNIAAPTDGAIPPRRRISFAGRNFVLQSFCIFCQDASY